MKEQNIPLKEQCKFCQKSLKSPQCKEMRLRINEEYNFKCPFFTLEKQE